jgi:hypothetical protein
MEKELAITTKVKINLETISNLLVSAFEGGSNYWYVDMEFTKEPDMKKVKENIPSLYEKARYSYYPFGGEMIVFTDEELDLKNVQPVKKNKGDEGYILNMDRIKRGLELMAEKYSTHFADIMNENDDATTGDVFLQLCLFEDVIFG